MAREFTVVIERDSDDWYVASVPALRGCHTQARTLDELLERVLEAIGVCVEGGAGEDEALSFVGIHRVAIGTSDG
jgi:predicted RNase H-like HicB family nuclease